MEKNNTDMTRRTSGDLLIHINTHHGTRLPGERLDWQLVACSKNDNCTYAYYMACFQVSPIKLFTAAAMLTTNDENQNTLAATCTGVSFSAYEN